MFDRGTLMSSRSRAAGVPGRAVKAEGGRATEAQMAFLAEIDAAGAFTAMPTGLDAALATLESWGLLRPNLTMRQIADNIARAK
jgi:hypothetical protein